MRTRRAIEIGLATGVALGFFVRGSVVHAPELAHRGAGERWALPTGYPTFQFTYKMVDTPDGPRVVLARPMDVRPGPDYAGQRLEAVSLRGRDLRNADFNGATLREVDFSNARLDGASFEGATYDRFCRWPVGFDPSLRGATLNDWPPP